MEEKEEKTKKREILVEREVSSLKEEENRGFPENVDFKKFLGCGG